MDDEDHMRMMPPTLFVRLRQEMAASRINKLLYSANSHRFADNAATTYMTLEADRLKEERGSLDGVDNGKSDPSCSKQHGLICEELESLYHSAVCLHLHLYSFFSPEPRLERRDDLIALYYAATSYLDNVFKLQQQNRLLYVPYYIMQMALAAGFALLKLLNSDLAGRLPSDRGRHFVLQTVDALRKSKVWPNDLLDRFAEVLAQLWKESSRGRSLHSMSQSPSVSNAGISNMFNTNNTHNTPQQPAHQRRESTSMLEDPLGLIVRSRMSMSVVFDCVWRWREAQVSGAAEQLDNTVMTNPTPILPAACHPLKACSLKTPRTASRTSTRTSTRSACRCSCLRAWRVPTAMSSSTRYRGCSKHRRTGTTTVLADLATTSAPKASIPLGCCD
jgi:transcriptional regulatory protein LEU3